VISTALSLSCQPSTTHPARQPPSLVGLTVIGRLLSKSPAEITGVAGLDSCGILIGDRSGRLLRVGAGGDVEIVDLVPGGRALTLESADPAGVVAWSDIPPFLATLRLSPFRIDSVPLAVHPWGSRWVGPAVHLGVGYAVAPIGNPRRYRREPNNAPIGHLVDVMDEKGSRHASSGPELRAGGGYIPWVYARSALGRQGDTLLVALFQDAVVERYLPSGGKVGEANLPLYFVPAASTEHVVEFDWIQRGDLAAIAFTPGIREATFGPTGALLPIRPYSYRWISRPNPYLPKGGAWEPESEGMEVYSSEGSLLGSFRLPVGVRAIRVDSWRRLFAVNGSGEVDVFQNPLAAPSQCQMPDSGIVMPDPTAESPS